MDNKDYVKPGWKTTEFWSMICSAIFGILILFGFITKYEADSILLYINSITGSIVTISGVVSYILSRGKAKQKSNIDYKQLISDIHKIVNESKEK